ncbi:MAG: hypothetical protein LAT57_12710 [Balneolales bacterium]|nr:hypothetical protein [Balneolales bacterium]
MSITSAKQVWNERYHSEDYVYGKHPNTFLCETLELLQSEILLSEGLLHNGTGSVIRFTGRKTCSH